LALKDLLLKHSIRASPREITSQYLVSAFCNATKVLFLGQCENVGRMSDMTWGLSGFRHQHADKLILICTGDSEALLKTLKENNLSQYALKRFRWLGYFQADKKLHVLAAEMNKILLKEYLKEKIESFLYSVIFVDGDGTVVIFSRYRDPEDNYEDDTEFKVSWSFGDPKSEAKKFESEIIKLAEKDDSSVFRNSFYEFLNISAECNNEMQISWDEEFQEKEEKSLITTKLYPHQEDAVEKWLGQEYKGIFKICTGGGKTIASLAAIAQFTHIFRSSKDDIPSVFVTAPTRILADQWCSEIKKFGFKHTLKAYESVNNWFNYIEPYTLAQNTDQPRFIVSTYCTFADERFQLKLSRLANRGVKAVWIADEMHNLAAGRLMKLMAKCASFFPFRIGLSATPEIENNLNITEKLSTYFGGILCDYGLENGIRDAVLCPYRYHPIPAYLANDIGARYLDHLKEIEESKDGSPAMLNRYRENRELIKTSGVQIKAFRDLLPKLILQNKGLSHTLIYCPPGFITTSDKSDIIGDDDDERRLLEDVVSVIRENDLNCSSIIGTTPSDQRKEILSRFSAGEVNALCAIGCLDEGVDVPTIHTAIILYSIDRLRQFIQRRGRILRKNKVYSEKIADIYDIVVMPQGSNMPTETAEKLLKKELRRYEEFASMAMNHEEAQDTLSKALDIACQ
jgi:superfamily II DNA or RNA helicase